MRVKLPFAVPPLVCVPAIEGLWEVLQHIPLPDTVAPPSEIIFPPDVAVVRVMDEADAVVNEGTIAEVVKARSFP